MHKCANLRLFILHSHISEINETGNSSKKSEVIKFSGTKEFFTWLPVKFGWDPLTCRTVTIYTINLVR